MPEDSVALWVTGMAMAGRHMTAMAEVFEALCAAAMARAGTHMPAVFEALCATTMAKAGTHMPEVFEALWATAIGQGRHAHA